jgi:hypothetical protein
LSQRLDGEALPSGVFAVVGSEGQGALGIEGDDPDRLGLPSGDPAAQGGGDLDLVIGRRRSRQRRDEINSLAAALAAALEKPPGDEVRREFVETAENGEAANR